MIDGDIMQYQHIYFKTDGLWSIGSLATVGIYKWLTLGEFGAAFALGWLKEHECNYGFDPLDSGGSIGSIPLYNCSVPDILEQVVGFQQISPL
jgi:hypothetical protein